MVWNQIYLNFSGFFWTSLWYSRRFGPHLKIIAELCSKDTMKTHTVMRAVPSWMILFHLLRTSYAAQFNCQTKTHFALILREFSLSSQRGKQQALQPIFLEIDVCKEFIIPKKPEQFNIFMDDMNNLLPVCFRCKLRETCCFTESIWEFQLNFNFLHQSQGCSLRTL